MGILTWLFLILGLFFLFFIVVSLVFGGTAGDGVGNGLGFLFSGLEGLWSAKI